MITIKDTRKKQITIIFLFMVLLLCFLYSIDLFIISKERDRLYSSTIEHIETELEMASTILIEPLLRHNFSIVELFINAWGEKDKNIIEFSAYRANKLNLARFQRPELINNKKIKIVKDIIFFDDLLLTLKITYDLTTMETFITETTKKLLIRSMFLTFFFGFFIWAILHIMAVRPLKTEIIKRQTAESKLQTLNQDLENIVKKRTTELTKKNLELKKEITAKVKIQNSLDTTNLELSLKNAELEQILYVTSHDLRSPIVNIKGFSDELKKQIESLFNELTDQSLTLTIKENLQTLQTKDIPESFHFIDTSLKKIDSLLDGLLKVIRLEKDELFFKKLDMNKMLSDICKTFDYQLKVNKVEINLDKLPACHGDERKINQIFSNLIDNAIKYHPREKNGLIHISGKHENNSVIYKIKDNGKGINEAHQNKIFDFFYRLNPSESHGIGLGLPIVKKITELHGGKIWVESEINQGCTFYISIPKKKIKSF